MSTRNRIVAAAAILAVAVTFILLLLHTRTPPQAPVPTAPKVVIILPETGKYSFIGQPIRQGLELEQQLNKVGPGAAAVDVIYEDIESDPAKSVTALTPYLSGPNRATAIVAVLTGVTNAVKDKASAAKIPVFAVTIHPTITQGQPYLFRVYYSAAEEARQLARLLPRLNAKRVAAIVAEDPQTQAMYNEALAPTIVQSRAEVVFHDTYAAGTTDFRAMVGRLATTRADVVLIPGGYASDSRALLKELTAQGVTKEARIVGGISLLDIATKYASEAVDGMIFLAPPLVVDQDPSPQVRTLRNAYVARYAKAPVHEVGYAYDTLKAIRAAIDSAKSPDGERVAAAARRIRGLDGVTGRISLDKDNDGATQLVPVRFVAGVIRPFEGAK